MNDVLFVFAHQDDEVGIWTRIVHEVRAGAGVWCAYLTDGARDVSAAVRDAESSRALARAGVAAERIAFLRDAEGRIADGTLFRALARARAMLGAWIAETGVRFSSVFTLDWEGGHHDHDAAHLVTLAACRDAGLPPPQVFSLYNGYARRPGLFRVASFVPGDAPVVRRSLAVRDVIAAALLPLVYRSQRRTWLGLGPGFAARTLLRRAELVRAADARRLADRPHAGPLLYETMFGTPAGEVLAASAALRAELAGTAAAVRTS